MSKDYYARLGVAKGASDGDIKSAYRKLAMKYHPDKNKDNKAAEAQFKEINEAYETLKDPQKKAAYDRFGHDAYTNQASGGGGGFGNGGFEGFAGNSGFSDMFESIFEQMHSNFGHGNDMRPDMRGSDLRYEASVTLDEAFRGKTIEVRIRTNVKCTSCKGSGSANGKIPKKCPHCRGTGVSRVRQGFFVIEEPCSPCGGSGYIIDEPCSSCRGSGRVNSSKTISITIPAGIENGTKMRLQGEGEAGLRGGNSGDLYVYVTVQKHSIFKRDGNAIYCDVPISFVTATLGGEIEVPTIDGQKATVTVPEGAQTGQLLKLRNKGMSVVRSMLRGDMFIKLFVETPTNLSNKQKDLLREFDCNKKNHPKSEGFFSKVKDFMQTL